jgi:outer membrane lipoprotein-sorting protein
MKRYYFFFLIVISIVLNARAQSAKEDLDRVNQTYKALSSYAAELEYVAYQSSTSKEPVQIEKGEVKMKGRSFYHKIGSIEVIRNKEYVLTVDHDEKSITKLDAVKESSGTPFMNIDLEKVLKLCTSVNYYEPAKGSAGYSLVFPSTEYSSVKIEFNRKTYLIEKMILFYLSPSDLSGKGEETAEKPRMEISFKNIVLNKDIPSSAFTYEKFIISLGNNKYICTQNYKNYSFNNQTSTNPY